MINQRNGFVKKNGVTWMLAFLPDCLAHRPRHYISCRWQYDWTDIVVFCCDFGLICMQKFACTDLFSTVVLAKQGEMF